MPSTITTDQFDQLTKDQQIMLLTGWYKNLEKRHNTLVQRVEVMMSHVEVKPLPEGRYIVFEPTEKRCYYNMDTDLGEPFLRDLNKVRELLPKQGRE